MKSSPSPSPSSPVKNDIWLSHFTGTQVFPPTQAIMSSVPEDKNFYTAYARTVIPEGWAGDCYSIPKYKMQRLSSPSY